MSRKVVVFDRWDRDFGDKGPRWAGRQSSRGWYSALNMWRYDDGQIGPRPGLKSYSLSAAPSGAVLAMGYYAANVDHGMHYVVGSTMYTFDADNFSASVATGSGNFDGSPDEVAFGTRVPPYTYWTVPGDASYRFNVSNSTLAEISGSPGGRAMCRWKDRLWVANVPGGEENRVYYSDAADFLTWDSLSYFDVDYEFELFSVLPAANLLIQSNQNLWTLTGAPETGAILRQNLRTAGRGVLERPRAIESIGDEFWCATSVQYHPGWTNGAVWDLTTWEQLKLPNPPRVYRAYAGPHLMMLDGVSDKALMFHEGRWTQHHFGVDVSSIAERRGGQGFVIAKDGETFYHQDLQMTRPGFTSDDYAGVGDATTVPNTMWLRTPEHVSENNAELTVRQVVVDFTKWDTGSASTNHFDVKVRATNLYDLGGHRDSSTLAWDEAGSAASTTGSQERANFTFGDQGSGAGFEIHLDNIRGVAVRSISVVFDENTGRAPG